MLFSGCGCTGDAGVLMVLKSEQPAFSPAVPRQAEEAALPPTAAVPVGEAGRAAEGGPYAA